MKEFICVIIILTFASCYSQKGLGNSGKKLYESFFVGEEGVQYFIKPLSFYTPDLDDNLNIDFTFRNKNDSNSLVNMNYSLIGTELVKLVDSIQLISMGNKVSVLKNTLLFKERKKKGFVSRFSAQSNLFAVMPLFKNENWKIYIYSEGIKKEFVSKRKTKKSIKSLNNNVFVLF